MVLESSGMWRTGQSQTSERIYEERGSSERKFAAPFFQRKEEQNGKRIRSPKSVS